MDKSVEIKNVCGVPMGGLPGETASLLVGSIFYDRQTLVKDAITGEFDKTAAKKLLDLQQRLSEVTGNPTCLDVIASTPDAMRRYLDFVIEHFNGPIMVDGSVPDAKIAGIRHLADCGLSHRAIYNSISPKTSTREFDAIASFGVKAAVIMAVGGNDFSAQSKIDLLFKEDGLIAKTKACAVEHCLVDPGVIDLPSIGPVMEVITAAKKNGCLAGTAPHNALKTWSGMIQKFGNDFVPVATAVLETLPIAWGADFVIYGPISTAPTVFPAVAMVNAILAQSLLERGKIPDNNFTMFKIA